MIARIDMHPQLLQYAAPPDKAFSYRQLLRQETNCKSRAYRLQPTASKDGGAEEQESCISVNLYRSSVQTGRRADSELCLKCLHCHH